MPVAYVHLSDIHFGQEKGSELIVHNDVKDRLIEDASEIVREQAGGRATGVIVTGDTAYGGKSKEYKSAGEWLDKLTSAIGCPKTSVLVVPGNHDIDRDLISSGCKFMLDQIIAEGEPKLDAYLHAKVDRDVLYHRFSAYGPFAEGYDCPLERSGGPATQHSVELVPGRVLRFMGLNSALICSAADEEGRLLLGARQHVLPRTDGEELVVLCHHPLHWLQDSEKASRFVKNRARVFVSGHEHNPRLKIKNIRNGCDLMMLESGATVPPKAENGFTYTYNLLIFDWDSDTDGLQVKIFPRSWSEENLEFEADDVRLGGSKPTVTLGSPNFRRAPRPDLGVPAPNGSAPPPVPTPTADGAMAETIKNIDGGKGMADAFPLLLLRFFRDLTPAQRLAVLVNLRALPSDFRDQLTLGMERRVVDSLIKSGRFGDLQRAISEVQENGRKTPGGRP